MPPETPGKNAVTAVRIIGYFIVGVDKTYVDQKITEDGIDHLRWQLAGGEIQPALVLV